MQWTERHVVLLVDKQIFAVPPHRTGNIEPVRNAATLDQASHAHIELVLVFFGFKRLAQNFWHLPHKSANRLLSCSYFVGERDFLA
ncbi:hypothetical protein OOJ09_30820 [Mesorhizobium qingshengii]|uniref:Uncharacterized protein n=1 Tax=Mesorhizobium qingshengii TaxID=1165689 RepID=A0ABT4R423_9HYPH|nr:hypothetical protein [Mesorhizobium qingshengii]MCZ8548577.1 hypothetical protein [Mesorhizobium qingshengii]